MAAELKRLGAVSSGSSGAAPEMKRRKARASVSLKAIPRKSCRPRRVATARTRWSRLKMTKTRANTRWNALRKPSPPSQTKGRPQTAWGYLIAKPE